MITFSSWSSENIYIRELIEKKTSVSSSLIFIYNLIKSITSDVGFEVEGLEKKSLIEI